MATKCAAQFFEDPNPATCKKYIILLNHNTENNFFPLHLDEMKYHFMIPYSKIFGSAPEKKLPDDYLELMNVLNI